MLQKQKKLLANLTKLQEAEEKAEEEAGAVKSQFQEKVVKVQKLNYHLIH